MLVLVECPFVSCSTKVGHSSLILGHWYFVSSSAWRIQWNDGHSQDIILFVSDQPLPEFWFAGPHPHPAPTKSCTALHSRVPFLDITNSTQWSTRVTCGLPDSCVTCEHHGETTSCGDGVMVMEEGERGDEATISLKVEVDSNAELCTEMLRETHGCEAYVFFVSWGHSRRWVCGGIKCEGRVLGWQHVQVI